jgi:hypothetical protein
MKAGGVQRRLNLKSNLYAMTLTSISYGLHVEFNAASCFNAKMPKTTVGPGIIADSQFADRINVCVGVFF